MTGQKLGRFEIIREIGKGAMGVVYLAHDPRIDRKIAIKMVSIPPGVSPEEAREARHRFVREAQAAGKLTHPNIITIYDVVEEPERTYIAMEYIDGETLEAHTRPGARLPLSRILSLISQACSALDYAHKSQVIHRDIKPANLMLLKGDLLKITDFGLAKNPDANLTQAGVLIGTPNYMSPEQISGRPMDGRSDFFSLGVVLYELLTSERPFGGDTISTIIYRILYEEPRPPRILNEKLPPSFDLILKRALAKDPADRFQNGEQFAEALNSYSTYHLKRPVLGVNSTLRMGREESSSLPVRPRERERSYPRAVPTPSVPVFAGQPVKVAAFAVLVILALLMFPRQIHEATQGDVLVRGSSKQALSQDKAGFAMPGFGSSSNQAPVPSRGGPQAQVQTREGTEIYLDRLKMSGNVIKLPESDEVEHTLLAIDGCREESRLFKGSEMKESYDLTELKPRVGALSIDSRPSKAQVFLDQKPLGTTPLIIPDYKACETHTFTLKKENYRDHQLTFGEETKWADLSQTLASVTLSEIPQGFVRFEPPPPYGLEVTLGDKPVPLKDGVMTLPEGESTVVLRSRDVIFKASKKVEVKGGKTLGVKMDWLGTGKLTVQAEPSNCRIFVDGFELGFPPVVNQDIVAGPHEIRVVPEDHADQAQSRTLTIERGVTSVEKFAFNF